MPIPYKPIDCRVPRSAFGDLDNDASAPQTPAVSEP
jgi:hypothetical protein